jgi:hypothetical protein
VLTVHTLPPRLIRCVELIRSAECWWKSRLVIRVVRRLCLVTPGLI